MQEYPNYKYRPRRRKHNKRASNAGVSPPDTNQPSHSPGPGNGNRRTNCRELSPAGHSIKLSNSQYPSSPYQSSTFSPVMQAQQQQYPYYSPTKTPPFYPNSESPYTPIDINTSDTSPSCSTDQEVQNSVEITKNNAATMDRRTPKESNAAAAAAATTTQLTEEDTRNLSTPEISPLDHDKNFRFSNQSSSSSSVVTCCHDGNNKVTYNYSPSTALKNLASLSTDSSYNCFQQRTSTYKQCSPGYHSSTTGQNHSAITAMGVSKGMVMMCTNQKLLESYEHNGIVTGTFYPPIVTTKDLQETNSHMYTLASSAPLTTNTNCRNFLSSYATSPCRQQNSPQSASANVYPPCSSPIDSKPPAVGNFDGKYELPFLARADRNLRRA